MYFFDHTCRITAVNIEPESEESNLFLNLNKRSCKAKDMLCSVQGGIIIWEDSIIHYCPFDRVSN